MLPFQKSFWLFLCIFSDRESGRGLHVQELKATSSQKPARNDVLSPTALKELSSAPHCMNEPSDEAADLASILKAALTDTLTQKTQLSHAWTPTHRNCEKINADCFKPLNLVVICYKAVNKECICHLCHVFREKDPAPLRLTLENRLYF